MQHIAHQLDAGHAGKAGDDLRLAVQRQAVLEVDARVAVADHHLARAEVVQRECFQAAFGAAVHHVGANGAE